MEACVLYYRSKEGDALDAIVWRHYGRQDGGLVEQVLEANRGLAFYGPVLPAGLTIALPEIEAPATTESVRLWG